MLPAAMILYDKLFIPRIKMIRKMIALLMYNYFLLQFCNYRIVPQKYRAPNK